MLNLKTSKRKWARSSIGLQAREESNLKSVRPLIDAPFAILMPITRQQASREIRVNPRGALTLIKARSSLEEFKTPTSSSCENVLNSVERSIRSLSRIIIDASFSRVIVSRFSINFKAFRILGIRSWKN